MPQSEAERREQDHMIGYRRYLNYDIEITHANGQISRLSRIMGQTFGGETQTPFYLTIAASFVQLYRIGERDSRPILRLVAFDEAFSKMDQDRIGATLDLFQQFGLQIITATPLERCEYLVPKICTSLVLSTIGDGVWIEPYRNYVARMTNDDGTPRRATNGVLRRMADAGALRLRWRTWEENNWMEAVDLVTEQVQTLYGLRSSSPRDQQDHALM